MRNKYFGIILVLCSVLMLYCSEENPSESIYNKYQGTWLWFRTVGGIVPRVITPKEGVTIKISYDKKGLFRKFRNDSLKVTANYNIEDSDYNRDKISYSNVVTNDYHFDSKYQFLRLTADTLNIWDGVDDGFFSFYKKIN